MSKFSQDVASIVIVNYKTPDLCINCLKSVHQNSTGLDILVVDNASNDGSIDKINRAILQNSWNMNPTISSKFNGGFSAGNNLGINASASDYILLLNSDTIVLPRAIELLIKTLDDNPKMGIASPRLESPDGSPQESCFRFQRPISELIRSACTGVITKVLRRYDIPAGVSPVVSYPEWTSFACVLIRRDVFGDIGLLDNEFFMYFEDVDFCKRARDFGWNIINNPEARVVHFGSGSSNVGNEIASRNRPPRYWYESRTRYYYKHYGYGGLLKANIFWHVGWLIAMLRKLFNRGYQPNVCDRQWYDIWTNFLHPNAVYIHPDKY